MNSKALHHLLVQFKSGDLTADDLIRHLQRSPALDLGEAHLDTHRELRKGYPEVVYGAGKTPSQVVQIAGALFSNHGRVLVTRVNKDHAEAILAEYPSAQYHELARCITLGPYPGPDACPTRTIGIVCAGTSDLPVAEEAAVTCGFLGNAVERFNDIGVAGLHRLLACLPNLQRMRVLICVAGMEGALPSVLGGLLAQPLIGVPTSVGYGTQWQGLTPLLSMLNSCSSGLTVVNVDNGFGAACAAHAINQLGTSTT